MRLILVLSLTLLLFGCQTQPKTSDSTVTIPENFDWQGHRGARGLLPENSIPAFLKALEYPIKTLEMDVVVTKDSQLIVSHEPWLSHTICSHPDGTPVSEAEEKSLNVFQMTYQQIQQYDCGSRSNARFPEQQAMKVTKPLLRDVVDTVEAYCKSTNRTLPYYNIEIKSQPEDDNIYTPEPSIYAQMLIDEIKKLGIEKRTCIQSFDVRALEAVRQIDSTLTTAFLIENEDGFDKNRNQLSFIPTIYSPYYELVDKELIQSVHDQNMLLIPWTVDDTTTMKKLIELGVDGIITDYPNFIKILEKK